MKHSAAFLLVLAAVGATQAVETNDNQDRFRRQLVGRERDLGVTGENAQKQEKKLEKAVGELEGMEPAIAEMAAEVEHLMGDVEHDMEHLDHEENGKKKRKGRSGSHNKKGGRQKKEKSGRRRRHGKAASSTHPTTSGGTGPTDGPRKRHHGKAEKAHDPLSEHEKMEKELKAASHSNGKARKLIN